jgi:excisionase family DNA binding protein
MSKQRPVHKAYPMPPPGRLALSLNETCGLTGLGMTSIRQAIDDELLPAYRLGKKIVVRRADIDEFLKKLPRGFAKQNAVKPSAG